MHVRITWDSDTGRCARSDIAMTGPDGSELSRWPERNQAAGGLTDELLQSLAIDAAISGGVQQGT